MAHYCLRVKIVHLNVASCTLMAFHTFVFLCVVLMQVIKHDVFCAFMCPAVR